MNIDQIIQTLISGLTGGAVYSLVALGFVIINKSSNIINFAQGEFVMLGGVIMFSLLGKFKMPYFAAALLTVGFVIVIGACMERLVIRPLRETPLFIKIMATLGISIFIRNTSMLIWGRDPISFPPISQSLQISFWGLIFPTQSLWALGLTGLLLIGLFYFFKCTLFGKAIRACAADPQAARLFGIDQNKIVEFSFGLSAGIGGLAGVFITPIFFTSYNVGIMLGLKGFVAAVIGGWGTSTGAVAGGLLLGLLEAFGVSFISSGYKNAIAFLILLFILYWKPTGILPLPKWERV
ncbi:MAG: branched-chain amino acid ABC transporter permease [Thermodesulfobacteriota bacterium]